MQVGKSYLSRRTRCAKCLEITLFSLIESILEFITKQNRQRIFGIIGVNFQNHPQSELFFVRLWIRKMFSLFNSVLLKRSFKVNLSNL
jgi:hypothetical protein